MNPFLEANTPCDQRTVNSDGVLLHYWIGVSGGSVPVFFLHGAGMDHRMFIHQLNDLVSDYRVIAWDMRGHGASRPSSQSFTSDLAVSDIHAVLAAEGVDRAVFIGQSLARRGLVIADVRRLGKDHARAS
jgi:3-oxoadipate enol-lactonase